MSALKVRETAIVPVTGVDLSASTGLIVKYNNGTVAVNDSATASAVGLCIEGNAATKQSSIALLGASEGTFRAKAGGTVKAFQALQQKNDGTLEADAGTGARVVCAVALQDGAAGDLIEVALLAPRVLA
jgi:hypothetical protein